ncbi:MAG TPA: hypothetical protein VMA73_01240 [Streptosporangiaceae bacterium]|nr:hypothetical protein [Streptosporangiaceae bacterium]
MSSSPAPKSRSLGRSGGMAEGRGLARATGSMALGTLRREFVHTWS